jgi:hypothetical protein
MLRMPLRPGHRMGNVTAEAGDHRDKNATVRMIARVTIPGDSVKVRLDNTFSLGPMPRSTRHHDYDIALGDAYEGVADCPVVPTAPRLIKPTSNATN